MSAFSCGAGRMAQRLKTATEGDTFLFVGTFDGTFLNTDSRILHSGGLQPIL